jgi:hypothetical protein
MLRLSIGFVLDVFLLFVFSIELLNKLLLHEIFLPGDQDLCYDCDPDRKDNENIDENIDHLLGSLLHFLPCRKNP